MKRLACLVLWGACSSGGGKPTEITIKELGVAITVPSSWEPHKRGDDVAIQAGADGVILSHDAAPVASITDARGRLMSGKIKTEETLPSGGYYFLSEVEFPTADNGTPMTLPYVTSFLSVNGGTIKCSIQLQTGQDPTPFANACKSLRKL